MKPHIRYANVYYMVNPKKFSLSGVHWATVLGPKLAEAMKRKNTPSSTRWGTSAIYHLKMARIKPNKKRISLIYTC